jgi:hypothetical protein
MKRPVRGVLAASAVLLVGAASASAAFHSPAHFVAHPSSQVRTEVRLASGSMGRHGWTVKAFREGDLPKGPRARRRPCLETRIERGSLFQSLAGCYWKSGYLTAASEPLVLTTSRPYLSAHPTMTAVGMAFAQAVTHLKAVFADGSEETIHLRMLNLRQARRVGQTRFRYAAFAVKGSWCPERLVSLNADEQPLWEAVEPSCPLASRRGQVVEGISEPEP